jgi:hypothetical protein
MTPALNVVPLVYGQIAVKADVKFLLAENGGYVADNRLVKTSCGHKSVELLVQFLLDA